MEAYIAKYGYIAIIVGTFLEGETTVLLGGIFSKLGYMELDKVMLCAFIGTLAGDGTFFLLGKLFKRNLIERYDALKRRVPLANRIIERYGNHIIFVVRFFVGVRGIILSLLGCTDLKKRTFLLYSAMSSALWSVVVSLIGYSFGNVVYIFVSDIKQYEKYIVPAVLGIVAVIIMVYRHIMRKKEEKSYGDQ
jgi:membrane protein DedA with SNARE-associated domain